MLLSCGSEASGLLTIGLRGYRQACRKSRRALGSEGALVCGQPIEQDFAAVAQRELVIRTLRISIELQ
jgi:hypothetical protein